MTRNRLAVGGLIVIVLLSLAALLADLLAPYPFAQQDTSIARQGPTAAHWLGTDELGRDMLSRLLQGARISLSVGLVAQSGAPDRRSDRGAGRYFGGWVDNLLSRLIDVMYSFPDLLLIIVISSSLKAALRADTGGFLGLLGSVDALFGGLLGMFIALALVSWLTVARLVRAQILSLKQTEFIEAARAARRDRPAESRPPSAAKRHCSGSRNRHVWHSAGNHRRGGAVIHRAWRAAADDELGSNDPDRRQRRPCRSPAHAARTGGRLDADGASLQLPR